MALDEEMDDCHEKRFPGIDSKSVWPAKSESAGRLTRPLSPVKMKGESYEF
jgi:hypothetical protein